MKLIDLGANYKSIKHSIDKAIKKTIESGSFILGKNGEELERRIAEFVGAKYSVGLNSGTDALFLAFKALGLGKGDEIITTPFTFIATAETAATLGIKPVFVDIDPETFNIDADRIHKAITKRTKALVPVHLYGQMADMTRITQIAKSKGLMVIEDAAQAIGAYQKFKSQKSKVKIKMAGAVGDVGCFSFFPTKNLGAFGDAGMVTTNSAELAEKIRMLRNHGSRKKYFHEFLGFSSRLDELQAAVLLAKLPRLKKWNETRRRIASEYTRSFKDVKNVKTPFTKKGNIHIYHQYTIRAARRDELAEYLKQKNIPTSIHYPLPLHLQPAFRYLGYKPGDFPEAEKAAKEVLSLPIYPELNRKDQEKIISAVKRFYL